MIKIRHLLILLLIFIFNCNKDETNTATTPLTDLRKINEISFSKFWKPSDSTIQFPDTIFLVNDTIYYQIKFDSALGNSFMIRKTWKHSYTDSFTSACIISVNCKRICGEFHKYDYQPLDTGLYQLSISYCNYNDNTFVPATYDSTVKRSFRIKLFK